MTNWYHDIEILELIFGLRNVGYTWGQIFDRLSKDDKYGAHDYKNPEDVRKRYGENKFKIGPNPNIPNDFSFMSYEEAYKSLCQYTGKISKVKIPIKENKIEKKILVISDLHIPFHNEQAIVQAVSEHKDADCLVIAGDFLDCYSISRFTKEKYVPLKEELVKAQVILNYLASMFPEIHIISGNHTDRPRKYFEQRISPDLMFLVQYDLLGLISKDLPNVRIVNDHYSFPLNNGVADIAHFTKIGKDFVVGHFERSSIVPTKVAHTAYNWLRAWEYYFPLGEIKLYLQGHTHRLSKTPLNHGEPVIGESGCMSKVQDYAIRADAKYRPHLVGYWVVYQNDEKTDLNKSNFVVII